MQQYNKVIQKLINFDDFLKGNLNKHNSNWPEIPDHPFKILITGKKNSLFNLTNQQTNINNFFIC